MTFTTLLADLFWLTWHLLTFIMSLAYIGGAICLLRPRATRLTLRVALILTDWGRRPAYKWLVVVLGLVALCGLPSTLTVLIHNTHGLW